jgi:hypothetical protein
LNEAPLQLKSLPNLESIEMRIKRRDSKEELKKTTSEVLASIFATMNAI